MIAVPLFVGAILLASTMLGTGVWLGARDYGRPDDGPDMSDLADSAAFGTIDGYCACPALTQIHGKHLADSNSYRFDIASSLAGVIAAEETAQAVTK